MICEIFHEIFKSIFKIIWLKECARTLTSISKRCNGLINCWWNSRISYNNGLLNSDFFGTDGKETFLMSPLFPLSRQSHTKILEIIVFCHRMNYVNLIPLHLTPSRIIVFKGISFVTTVRHSSIERFKVVIIKCQMWDNFICKQFYMLPILF